MGVPCVAVTRWQETASYLEQLLARAEWPSAAALAEEYAQS